MGLHIIDSDMSIYNTVQNIMEKYNKKAIFDDLDKYDYLAKESDFIEVTEWHNGEGWDIYINKLKLTGYKTGRNEICPFCTSGKKFKNCACYKVYKNESYLTGIDAHNAKEQLGKLRTNG